MERRTKMSKNEKEGFENRSPLQRLNGLQIRKPKTSNLSSTSSSSASVTFEAPNGSSSSSSRTHLHRKPKNLSTVSNNASLKSSAVILKPRSKENEVPRIPISQKSMKKQPPRLDKKQYGKANKKPTIKNDQRSKLCSAQRNPVKVFEKRSEKLEGKSKNCEENGSGELPIKLFEVSNDINLDCVENCTPVGKTASVCGLDSVSFDYSQNVKEDSILKTANGKNSDTAVKTPPVEASVSPEIQCGSHSKMPVLKSAATPVCYGAGHLLSGVTDKRKCRRRGSLKGGCEKINLFDDEKNDGDVVSDLLDSLIPFPAEASVRWVLSPCDEAVEDSENRLQQCKMIGESDFVELDLLSSPSTLCGNVTDFGCDNSNKKMHEHLLVTTPNSVSNCNNVRHNVIENNSTFSLGSLSSGNIIQTPSSDSSSYGCLRESNADFVQFELDSITKTLNKVELSPSGISLQCADMDLSSSIGLSQVQDNVNSVCSSVSDSTLENLTLSQTRISWRDGLVSRIDENDEFDCCRCLSDEEIDADACWDKQLHPMPQPGGDKENDLALSSCLSSCLGTESGENEENDPCMYRDEHEPCISAQGKEKLSSHRPNASAESICTNGGDLVASGDSDWMYFRENHLF